MFITMEGTDGSGKTTQLNLLNERLVKAGFDVVRTREPGGTKIAEEIRSMVLSPKNAAMLPLTEALLYAAARAQHVSELILPALAAGKIVLCDRFFDSSIAYQAYGRGLGAEGVTAINRAAMAGLVPDRTYLLMVDKDAARVRSAGREADRIEGEGPDFFDRVRMGYRDVAREERVLVLDGLRAPDLIAEEIWKDLAPRLPRAI